MTVYDNPNREAVGLEPIWTGADVAPEPEPEPEPKVETAVAGFDPGEHTVVEVEAYLEDHPDEADAVLAAEAAGKNRTSLVGGG